MLRCTRYISAVEESRLENCALGTRYMVVGTHLSYPVSDFGV